MRNRLISPALVVLAIVLAASLYVGYGADSKTPRNRRISLTTTEAAFKMPDAATKLMITEQSVAPSVAFRVAFEAGATADSNDYLPIRGGAYYTADIIGYNGWVYLRADTVAGPTAFVIHTW